MAKTDAAQCKGANLQRKVHARDGRTLAAEDCGDPAGRPVLVHMGTPNSRHLYGRNVRDAAERGLRLIGYDRPGYGESSPQPGRTVADCADDVRTICAELGIDRLATWGISGGGPHVLACAALLPDLVTAVASLASPAPYGAEGLDYFAGMGQVNIDHTVNWRDIRTTRGGQVNILAPGCSQLAPPQAAEGGEQDHGAIPGGKSVRAVRH